MHFDEFSTGHSLWTRPALFYKILCILVHHAINGRAPSYLTELVTSVVDIPGRATLRSAAKQDLFVPRTRLVSSERAFSVAGPKAWNKLPVDIRLTTDTQLFKKKLKTFLFTAVCSLSWISSIAFSDFDFDIIQCTLDYFTVKLATGLCVSGTQKWLIINK